MKNQDLENIGLVLREGTIVKGEFNIDGVIYRCNKNDDSWWPVPVDFVVDKEQEPKKDHFSLKLWKTLTNRV